MNELSETKKSSASVKMITDGRINVKVLFESGSKSIIMTANLLVMSNSLPYFDHDDSGIERRVKILVHRRAFSDDPRLVDRNNSLQEEYLPP